MKNVFVVRGNQDGVIAVCSTEKKAKTVAKGYVDHGWDSDKELKESDSYFKRGDIEASWEEFSVNFSSYLNNNKQPKAKSI